jgi:hypothetical protein
VTTMSFSIGVHPRRHAMELTSKQLTPATRSHDHECYAEFSHPRVHQNASSRYHPKAHLIGPFRSLKREFLGQPESPRSERNLSLPINPDAPYLLQRDAPTHPPFPSHHRSQAVQPLPLPAQPYSQPMPLYTMQPSPYHHNRTPQ